MSSDSSVSDYKALLLNNYISLFGCTIIGYDYILVLSREVEYIWRKRWTWVSTMYILVRIAPCPLSRPLLGSVGRTAWFYLCTRPIESTVLFLVSCWTFPVFICAGDFVMILRVYTLWNRSRIILSILLVFFILQVIVSVVLPAIYNSSPVYFIPSTAQVLNFSVCSGTFVPSVPSLLGVYNALPRFLVGASLFILAVARTLKQSIEMYNATKQWQPNRYIAVFVRDGVFYFFINTTYNVINVVTATPTMSTPPIVVNVLGTIVTVLLSCCMPRFIITVREMYDRDFRGRWQDIDTGFGWTFRGASYEKGGTSTIAFAGAEPEESQTFQGDGSVPGVQLETVGECSRHV